MNKKPLLVFGEVLFDLFPTGEEILGGAPFNVAWHLQALGDQPYFISRVGSDAPGKTVLQAMTDWGMDTTGTQVDGNHPTGRVEVRVIDSEPSYTIVPNCAYDFIDAAPIQPPASGGLLYHGTLGLRHELSQKAFRALTQNGDLEIFLDVNLRSPWWDKETVFHCMQRAQWVKMNQAELRLLGFASGNLRHDLNQVQQQFQLKQLILTRGEAGVLVCTERGEFHEAIPGGVEHFVDTVGAGDAFSAVYLHGLRSRWSIAETLEAAQRFAGKVIGLRGATTTEAAFYHNFIASLS